MVSVIGCVCQTPERLLFSSEGKWGGGGWRAGGECAGSVPVPETDDCACLPAHAASLDWSAVGLDTVANGEAELLRWSPLPRRLPQGDERGPDAGISAGEPFGKEGGLGEGPLRSRLDSRGERRGVRVGEDEFREISEGAQVGAWGGLCGGHWLCERAVGVGGVVMVVMAGQARDPLAPTAGGERGVGEQGGEDQDMAQHSRALLARNACIHVSRRLKRASYQQSASWRRFADNKEKEHEVIS